MAYVNLSINGRIHEIACDDSQVARIHVLGQMIDGIAQDLLGQLGNVPDTRLMVMVALSLADELAETRENLNAANNDLTSLADGDQDLAEGIESLAARIEAIAERLERP
ncbi:cell division protein ZapA [Magnetospirillum sulfuroxidans]|uniref:Cell division protein ZapA n=1 Tax=Magnetospirillum sulfuroxidans TaxID=611300 RepID=A0ABS5I7U6_9PROT|nr:cell division protein ZapA [Magnetospirillum sulfuroxidans]MBR9970384.1 cell division protein ZapA [Magnetospirillum sulfuroxidans]